ncbi:TPM domain-containing protein [Balneicella halophila]|nr:TPM domain-containing protein [Balneicella halophila]
MPRKIFTILLCCLWLVSFAQEGIPEKPKVERLVNDLAGILTEQEEQQLEQKLVKYAQESSTQVAVVTVKSLNGYERADFATRLAHKWGIGSSKNDNGILLLVKPKYRDSKGQIQIAVGYGLEGAATDLASGQIRDNIIIPHFKNNDYFSGIDKGTDALIALTKGEYNESAYPANEHSDFPIFLLPILFILFVIILSTLRRKASKQYQMSKTGGSIPSWMLIEMLTRRSGKGDFDDFNSGSGGFGGFGGGFGSGGGFGGFGGGGFGGGGAGGSW